MSSINYPTTSPAWGASPYIAAFGQQPYLQPLPIQSAGYGTATQPVLPLLQIVMQQLQHIQALEQQQLFQLQQLLQLIPAQLQQLQQLVQVVPQQVHQLQQQWQPFGQGVSGSLGIGIAPQLFGGQSAAHVM